MISGDGETQGGAAGTRRDVLHRAFTKGGFANEGRALEVLEGSSNQFGGTGGVSIEEDDKRVLAFNPLFCGCFEGRLLRGFGSSLGAHDFRLWGEKEAEDLNGNGE